MIKSLRAPVALFAYARPDHTRRTVEALQRNTLAPETDLVVFSDAPRSPDRTAEVDAVRAYLDGVTGFRSIDVRVRPRNLGLANSIIDGVTQVLVMHDRIIVLEDDMVTSPHFLTYMNQALDRLADDERVISIHGYVYPVARSLPEAFFLEGADCWGWATWRRGWQLFDPDGSALLAALEQRKLLRTFDFNDSYPYSRMLQRQIDGTNDSWAIRWYASALLAGKLTLYPGRSLVQNIGNDSSGTHCANTDVHDAELSASEIDLSCLQVAPSPEARASFESYFRESQGGIVRQVLRRLKRSFG